MVLRHLFLANSIFVTLGNYSLNNDSILEIKLTKVKKNPALFLPILTALTDENGLWKGKTHK